jgi:hypothetical protein
VDDNAMDLKPIEVAIRLHPNNYFSNFTKTKGVDKKP